VELTFLGPCSSGPVYLERGFSSLHSFVSLVVAAFWPDAFPRPAVAQNQLTTTALSLHQCEFQTVRFGRI
jgi:hypothetical protein